MSEPNTDFPHVPWITRQQIENRDRFPLEQLRPYIGKYVAWGLPSINSLVVGFGAYVVAGKLGLIRGIGTSRTMDSEQAEITAVPATS